MKLLDIGEVATRANLPPSTLRYYEEIGLIGSIARHGLRRQYDPQVMAQLALISWGKSAGFSLEHLARMFGKSGAPDLPRAEIRRKGDELDQRIRELTALRDMLRHVADCRAPSHMECPTFRRLLAKALAGHQPAHN